LANTVHLRACKLLLQIILFPILLNGEKHNSGYTNPLDYNWFESHYEEHKLEELM